MDPERWQQVNTLLDAALDLPPGRRQAYIETHCPDDQALRREVLSLLEAHEQADSFLEAPARDYAATLISMNDVTDPLLGRHIDDYRILDVLGRGGMGIVYRAEDEALSRTVALKMIDPALARDEAFVRRFRAEARALARIDSRHIVRVHAMRQTAAGLYIVMEYVDGGTLSDRLQGRAMPWSAARGFVEQMLTALEHAHSVGVIHRDIKPSNILLSSEGLVKITDFGLAKVRQPDKAATVTQGVAGTLFYMSPEQVKGSEDLDHRSDLYSMGMTIYQMLTGRLPFDRDASQFSIMRAIVEESFPPPTQFKADVPAHVAEAVMKAIAKEPRRRYQSAAEMRTALASAGAGYAGVDAATVVDAAPFRPTPASKGPSRRMVLIGGLGALGGLLVIASVFLVLALTGGEEPAAPEGGPDVAESEVTVFTVPGGARVYAEGRLLGETPLQALPVAVEGGTLRLSFEKEGYASRDTTLRVEAGAPVTLRAVVLRPTAPDAVTVQVTSAPSGATVYINNTRVGPTPMNDLMRPAGQAFVVRVSRDGCQDWTRRYEDPPATIHADLSCRSGPAPGPTPSAVGTLTLRVAPEGTVRVEGATCQAGVPCQVPAGNTQVTFTHPRYGSRTATVSVSRGQTAERTYYFEQEVAVQVRHADTGSPIWATVFIDGQQAGMLQDLTRALGPGSYRLTVSRDGYDVLTPPQNVTVEPGFEKKKQIVLFQIRPL